MYITLLFCLLFTSLYMIYLCAFARCGFWGYIMQMASYARVCIGPWPCAASIYYGRFVVISCCMWQCPLSAQCPLYNRLMYMISLCSWRFWCVFICFLLRWWYPLPIFQRLVTSLSPAQKFLIWGKEKELFQTCEKISFFIMFWVCLWKKQRNYQNFLEMTFHLTRWTV